MIITANANPRVKRLVKLNKSASARKNEGVFLVEGVRVLDELPLERLTELYVSQSALEKYSDFLATKGVNEDNQRLTILSDDVFKSLSETKTPQGVLAVVKRLEHTFDDVVARVKASEACSLLILESIQDPGNLGTILRSAEAAGVTAIIMGGATCDIYSPKVVRSTMGSIFRTTFVTCGDLALAANELKAAGVTIYGAHLDGADLYKHTFAKKAAFLIGNEGNGLSDELSATADELLRIPMAGSIESLNAAVSATLISYEYFRQSR